MTDEQLRDLISDLVQEVDYDIWKALFVFQECPDEAESFIEQLMQIVRSHLDK